MNEPSQMNDPNASAIVPLKRKRGRPRKHLRPDLDRVRRPYCHRDHNPNHMGAPGFSSINQSNPHQVNTAINPSDYLVGQAVHGVIEATFDAGYLLTVRVGNSATVLRGVVFKPGHFVPVSADIDVAPGVQMVRRNQVPLPRENYGQVYGQRNGAVHTARASNPVLNKGKQVPSVVNENSPGISRGNLVPVVLQPVNLSNGAQGVALKGKQVLDTANPSNGTSQFISFQSQHSQQEVPSAQTLQEAEAKGMPFEKLLTEIIKRNQVQVLTRSTEANTSSAAKFSADDSATASDDFDDDDEEEEDEDDDDDDDALSVEPIRAVQPDVHSQPAVESKLMENYRTGKMTELLQVLQANMTENSVAQVQNAAADPGPKPNETGNLGQDSGGR